MKRTKSSVVCLGVPLSSSTAVPPTAPETAVTVRVSPSTSVSPASSVPTGVSTAVSSVAVTVSSSATGASLTQVMLTVTWPMSVSVAVRDGVVVAAGADAAQVGVGREAHEVVGRVDRRAVVVEHGGAADRAGDGGDGQRGAVDVGVAGQQVATGVSSAVSSAAVTVSSSATGASLTQVMLTVTWPMSVRRAVGHGVVVAAGAAPHRLASGVKRTKSSALSSGVPLSSGRRCRRSGRDRGHGQRSRVHVGVTGQHVATEVSSVVSSVAVTVSSSATGASLTQVMVTVTWPISVSEPSETV